MNTNISEYMFSPEFQKEHSTPESLAEGIEKSAHTRLTQVKHCLKVFFFELSRFNYEKCRKMVELNVVAGSGQQQYGHHSRQSFPMMNS